jgi:hypothetical protein
MYADVAEPPALLILLFYQVEIRLIQFLHRNSSIHSQLPTRRDSTTRLWQLQGCYVEIAGLPAALGMTTLYSMRAYRPLSTLTGCGKSRLRSHAAQVMVLLGHDTSIYCIEGTDTGLFPQPAKLPFAGASTTGGAPTFRGGFEVIRGKGVPSNTDTNANDRRLNEALEPVSGAAARALRDSTRRGLIRRDAHFPGMPYTRDSAATRSENCGVKYRYQRRCVVDRFHFGASARNAANSVAACSLRPASA